MNNTSHVMKWLALLAFLLLCITQVSAKGLKGNLEEDEIDFIKNAFIPILIKSNLCVKATGDCREGHIYCMSSESLSCSVYGISDTKVIKEIFLAMLNSGLNISHLTFWKSKYHETSLFEKPILKYIDSTGGK